MKTRASLTLTLLLACTLLPAYALADAPVSDSPDIIAQIYSDGAFIAPDGFAWEAGIDDVIAAMPNNDLLDPDSATFEPMRRITASDGTVSLTPDRTTSFGGMDFTQEYDFHDENNLYVVIYCHMFDDADIAARDELFLSLAQQFYDNFGTSTAGDSAYLDELAAADLNDGSYRMIWPGADGTYMALSSIGTTLSLGETSQRVDMMTITVGEYAYNQPVADLLTQAGLLED